jgi:hypothetical protein
VLKQAELAVKSTDEFNKTAEAILQYADDPQWIEAIKDQQEKRSAHAAEYTEFISAEGECQSASALIRLADDVMNRTEDQHYARKLLQKAEAMSQYFPEFLSLADAVTNRLQDKDWVRGIYSAQLEKSGSEADTHHVVDGVLANLNDTEWVKTIYAGLEQRANNSSDYVRLAQVVLDKLGDADWTGQLFDKAEAACETVVSCTSAAIAAQDSLGDADRTRTLLGKAKTLCGSYNDYDTLVRTAARRSGFEDVVRDGIQAAEGKLSNALDLTSLAECVLTHLDDRQWARRIYQSALSAPDAKQRRSDILLSIKNRLGDEAWARKLYRQI